MHDVKKVSAKTLIVGGICSLTFIILLTFYYDFVLDDAFIAYRYSQNLAQGHGLVWNISEDPVEGYTSFLWVVLNSLAMICGLNPVIFSKLMSVISALAIVWILSVACRKIHWSLAFIFTGAIAFSPPFAFLTMQGLETAFTTLLLIAASLISLKILSQPSKKLVFYWYTIALLGATTRPDTVPFTGGMLLALFGLFALKGDYNTIRRLCFIGIIFVLIGSLYMAWRISYFGHVFPNTFYAKIGTGTSLIKSSGTGYVVAFIKRILLPYLVLIAFLLGRHFDRERALKTAPILLGCLLFGFYLLTIIPIQGFLWRFIFPVFPAFLLAVIYCFTDYQPARCGIGGKFLYLIMVLFFAAWTLRFIPQTFFEKQFRNQHDRVAIGRKLAGLDAVMFTTECGAVPFYSGWKSIDMLGLTSEQIAREGFSIRTMKSFNPDLVIVSSRTTVSGVRVYRPYKKNYLILNQYMIDNGFVAIAASHRGGLGDYLYYFARKDSDLFDEIVERLLNIDELRYGNLSRLMLERRIPIYQAGNRKVSEW